jgi:RNA polymerase sigma factor (sigma-70 family)
MPILSPIYIEIFQLCGYNMRMKERHIDNSGTMLGNGQHPSVVDSIGMVKHAAAPFTRIGRKLGIPREDLEQVAAEEFVRKSPRYNPSKGELSTYMERVMRNRIMNELRDRGWRVSGIPRGVKEHMSTVYEAETQIMQETGTMPTIDEIAKRAGIDPETVCEVKFLSSLGVLNPSSWSEQPEDNASVKSEKNKKGTSSDINENNVYDRLIDELSVNDAVSRLSPRKRKIVRQRFYTPDGELKSQTEIAEAVGVSQMTVSNELRKAEKELKSFLSDDTSASK